MIALAGYWYSLYRLLVVYVLLYHLYLPGEVQLFFIIF